MSETMITVFVKMFLPYSVFLLIPRVRELKLYLPNTPTKQRKKNMSYFYNTRIPLDG